MFWEEASSTMVRGIIKKLNQMELSSCLERTVKTRRLHLPLSDMVNNGSLIRTQN